MCTPEQKRGPMNSFTIKIDLLKNPQWKTVLKKKENKNNAGHKIYIFEPHI